MSLWKKYQGTVKYPSLQSNLEVDTLIIGGGMTGLNTLYQLKDQKRVCLVEANRIGSGVSMNTTGKINYLQDNTFVSNLKKGKRVLAQEILASQIYGMKLLIDIINKEQIDCDLEQVTSYIVTNEEKNIELLKQVKDFLQEKEISVVDGKNLFNRFSYGIGVKDTFVFNPVKYMSGLLKTLENHLIYENTKIINLVRGESYYFCHTDKYCIRAKEVIVACHYPFFLFPFFLPIKSSIEKSYIIARRVPKNEKYTYITLETPSESMRFYEDGKDVYQLCLGDSHDISTQQDDAKHFEQVQKNFDISSSSIVAVWSNTDLITQDALAYVGRIAPHLYLSTGYQTWGMIQSVLSAKILGDLFNHEENAYAHLFLPSRKSVDQFVQVFVSAYKNTKSFLGSKYYPKSWYAENLSFYFEKARLVATYVDDKGLHTVHPVCPHMKCGLIFNYTEKTWDCPCHSSRFDLDGKCIKGPAKYSISLDRSKD